MVAILTKHNGVWAMWRNLVGFAAALTSSSSLMKFSSSVLFHPESTLPHTRYSHSGLVVVWLSSWGENAAFWFLLGQSPVRKKKNWSCKYIYSPISELGPLNMRGPQSSPLMGQLSEFLIERFFCLSEAALWRRWRLNATGPQLYFIWSLPRNLCA